MSPLDAHVAREGGRGIEVRAVRRSFGRVAAVRDISLVAAPGQVTGLVGPNGAGKTTLLLMLASLLQPDAGDIRIEGVDPVAEPQAARRLLGWMPDSLGSWATLTSRETLVATARLYGLPRVDAAARADVLLATVGLTPLADTRARVLSRGQKQRLALARALVHDPRVLLLDEPAAGLDPQARVDLRILLRELAAGGRTILISSHVLAELEEVVDSAAFVVAGETVSTERIQRAASRQRMWRLRVAGDGNDASALDTRRRAIASALGDAASIAVDRRDLLVPFASEREAAAALRVLVEAGHPVTEFAPASGDLEHAFLDLKEPRP